MAGLTKYEREAISGGIEVEGFGYWIEHYGYKGDNDPHLKKLCQDARASMDELRGYLEDNELIY